MQEFFKYLTVGDEIRSWGMYVTVAGKSTAAPYTNYPLPEHPSGYYFNYLKGRILNEYQVNYITQGQGVFENESGSFNVVPGTVLIIRKNQWHRYKPDKKTGWVEHYLGFNGILADHFMREQRVLQGKCVIHVGKDESILGLYQKSFDILLSEKPGYQEIATGMIVQLLGILVACDKQKEFSSKPLEKSIQNLCFDMRSNPSKTFEIEQYAIDCHVGRDYFRNMFKKYTGMSPHQYYLNIKILRAKELLLTTNASVKEIGFLLGFQSAHYFNRCFLKKTGITPGKFKTNKGFIN